MSTSSFCFGVLFGLFIFCSGYVGLILGFATGVFVQVTNPMFGESVKSYIMYAANNIIEKKEMLHKPSEVVISTSCKNNYEDKTD